MAALRHLSEMPLGYFEENPGGKLRKIIDENSAQVESYLAHQMPDLVGAQVAMVVGFILMLAIDWRIGLPKIDLVDGSRYYTFTYDLNPEMAAKGYMTVEKGSVTVNGVSLTVCNSQDNSFQVAIIPYTYEHTNFHQIEEGSIVNLEFDIIGKYISRIMHFEKD